jgi:hypothetical protein
MTELDLAHLRGLERELVLRARQCECMDWLEVPLVCNFWTVILPSIGSSIELEGLAGLVR